MNTAIEQKLEELKGQEVTVAMKHNGRILNAPLARGRIEVGCMWCHIGHYRMLPIRKIKSIDTAEKIICL